MSFVYEGQSLPTEYNYVLAVLCGLYHHRDSLTEEVATSIAERLTAFLETGEINRSPIVVTPRDPFMEFWRVYGSDIEDDNVLVEDVEYCLEWLGKSDGSGISDDGDQG